jgi:hypothetical protein
MIFQYILLIWLVAIIVVWATIKIKYPFWNNQPVFHTYDYVRALYKQPFVVHTNWPRKTKYVDPVHVYTYPVNDDNLKLIKDAAKMLQSHYLSSERIDYMIQSNVLYALHTGQPEQSYFSVYKVLEYELHLCTFKTPPSGAVMSERGDADCTFEMCNGVKPNKNDAKVEIVKMDKILGCITSRALSMYIRPTKTEAAFTQIPVYFMDFLCVHREQDYKNISRKLLQTHEYNQRTYNKNIQCSLLKKDGEQFSGIRPLITYNAYSYNIPSRKVTRLKTSYHVKLLKPGSVSLFFDFCRFNMQNEPKTAMFDIMVLPSIGNIVAQIKEKSLYVGCLRYMDIVLGFYFVKDAYRYNEAYESKTLTLVASMQTCSDSRLFYLGFLHVLREIIHTNADYKAINIENIGHNQYINDIWTSGNMPINATNMAYYSYNYVYPCSPIDQARCFILQ